MQQVMWTPGVTLDQMERAVIEAALSFHRGNKSASAASLGISVRTIDNKLEKWEADDAALAAAADERRQAEADFQRRSRQMPAGMLVLDAAVWPPLDPSMAPPLVPDAPQAAPRAAGTAPGASERPGQAATAPAAAVASGRNLPPPAAYGARGVRR